MKGKFLFLFLSFILPELGHCEASKKDTIVYKTICKCDSIVHTDTLKCFDSQGRKQGYWEYFRCTIQTNRPADELYDKDTIIEHLMSGNYKDGVLTGKWRYADLSNGNIEYSITYNPDGSRDIEKRFGNYKISFNKDSSVISGSIIHLVADRSNTFSLETGPNITTYEIIIISRIIEDKVHVSFKYGDKIIRECTLDLLDFVISEIDMGIYDKDLIH